MATFSLRAAFSSVKAWALAHRIGAGVIAAAILGAAWFGYGALAGGAKETTYVLGTVEKGTVVSTISGSGQVTADNEVELSPKASGDIVSVNVRAGQAVAAGQVIASVDTGTSGFELESARLSYQKALASDKDDSADAQTALAGAEDDARSAIATSASALTSVLDGLSALYDQGGYMNGSKSGTGSKGTQYRKESAASIQVANASISAYRKAATALTRDASDAELSALLLKGYEAASDAATAARATQDAVIYFRDQDGATRAAEAAYASVTATVSDANSAVSEADSARDALASAAKKVADLESGANALDIRSAQLSLQEKQEAYDDHFVVAPFAGVVAKVSAKLGDAASSGTAVATIITKEQLAEITLNEVDVAKVRAGQKATVTFDAIDGLSIAGTVAEVDGIGTVSQGVVSYTVKIAFDTQDDRVKPGMTANADIQTGVATDVLMVPASAVKSAGGGNYVLVPVDAGSAAPSSATGVALASPPVQVPVETGLADDANIEIRSGLSEGQTIVVKSVSANAAKSTAASATSRGGFGGGGAVRVP